ncbi:MAG TPA: hypothetical protein VFI05_04640 [Nitrospiraceae bacterium]|nr:hypothetical protein [Nitrospiraceae bacterium]
MDTRDEVPLEDHRYFWARLEHLEHRHPAGLLSLMEQRKLTEHLRGVTRRAMLALAALVYQNLSFEQADEMVMNQIVADPLERSRLNDSFSRRKLRHLLNRYKDAIPKFTRTYLSENETTE